MSDFNVAIVGASGAVGQELVRILEMRKFPVKQLTLLASKRSAGKTIESEFGNITIEEFSVEKFEGQDFVFFATSGDHAKEFAPKAAQAGAVVIDNSSAFRLDDNVPLVVPEVNPKDAFSHKGIIANPNCSTIQMVVALNPIHQYSRIKRIVVSTYQAVSGAGQDAINELNEQLKAVLDGSTVKVEQFTKQIAFNVIPHIDVFQENGYTKEEMKMVNETWKIMGDDQIKISANCVRVPVIRAHSEAINIETESFVGEAKARELFDAAQDLEVIDSRENGGYPTPIEVSETMKTYVGRIREDISCDNGLALWCVADQLWKGAALNAVQIAELLVSGE
ncbi:aspartate-semialdehyde dehydrogenase [Aliikangiella sp. G2MR2-5]|uniref:aspartate-semialdehyde dehydrogenase n=1 Tax=Aliikangiella sp. G2MR2-5 TaxID=2788943 RepID=UPI0018AA9A75|nr:aspartate-semialdehyde dehydrogenase [Aliikangiella sp. G2MR2-5]